MSFVVRSLSFLSARQQIASLDSFSCWSMSLVGHSIYTCKRTEERKQVLNIMSMRSGARSRIWELLHLFQSVCIKCAWKEKQYTISPKKINRCSSKQALLSCSFKVFFLFFLYSIASQYCHIFFPLFSRFLRAIKCTWDGLNSIEKENKYIYWIRGICFSYHHMSLSKETITYIRDK
jgi:hypothetical protein